MPAALSIGISFPRLASILWVLGPPRTVRASARSRETLGTEGAGGGVSADTPVPRTTAPTAASSQGVLEVAEDARLLGRRGLREASVVQVADETLEPRNGAGRGQRLVGEMACGDAGHGGLAGVSTLSTASPTACSLRLVLGAQSALSDPYWGPCGWGAHCLPPPPSKKSLVLGGLTFVVLKGGVGVADSHQDEEEKERPQQLHQELDLGEGRKRCGSGAQRGGGTPATPPWPISPGITGCLLRYRKFFQSSSMSCVQKAMVGMDGARDGAPA